VSGADLAFSVFALRALAAVYFGIRLSIAQGMVNLAYFSCRSRPEGAWRRKSIAA